MSAFGAAGLQAAPPGTMKGYGHETTDTDIWEDQSIFGKTGEIQAAPPPPLDPRLRHRAGPSRTAEPAARRAGSPATTVPCREPNQKCAHNRPITAGTQ